MKTLYIVSGADRVGKSTFCKKLQEASGGSLYHFSEPDTSPEITSIFSRYLDVLKMDENKRAVIFDRSYVCGYILERFRENNHNHIGDLVKLELQIPSFVERVLHVGLVRPWYEVALRHKEELDNGVPLAPWALSNKMIARMNEHRFYYEELLDFYNHVTMFPHVINPESEI